MIILGLTGSIGMGKSTAAADFRRLGVAVHDADATVHQLMAPNGAAFEAICQAFPDVCGASGINRKRLGDQVFSDAQALKCLEMILHPLVRKCEGQFLQKASRRRQKVVVLDIPLLYETGGQKRCDAVVVVTAPDFVQRARVLARAGMSPGKFESIRAKQVPDALKRRQAEFVVHTGLGRLESRRAIRQIVDLTRSWKPRKWPPIRVR